MNNNIEYPASHPEQPHVWVKQWNRFVCVVSGCHTYKTLEHGVEYEDMTGRLDPFALDVAPEPEPETPDEPAPEQTKPAKRSSKSKEVNTDGEVADDLTAAVE